MNTTHGINWRNMVKYDADFNIRDKKLPKKLGEEKQCWFLQLEMMRKEHEIWESYRYTETINEMKLDLK